MISDESRNTKPYAVPVRFLPYHSITDNKLRQLQMEIEDAMIDLNMIPVGKYS
jgi:poly(3-hydroxyalkanoate) synthetase